MWSLIDKMTEKVVFVVSGDLAHRFEASGPYGYSNTSQPFDEVRQNHLHTVLKF